MVPIYTFFCDDGDFNYDVRSLKADYYIVEELDENGEYQTSHDGYYR